MLNALDLSRADCVWEGPVLEGAGRGLLVQILGNVKAKLPFLVHQRLQIGGKNES